MDRVTAGIQGRTLGYTGRLCRVCLGIFYVPPSQDYVPPHRLELPNPTEGLGDWCHGSYEDWRPPGYGTAHSPDALQVDTRTRNRK